MYNRNGEIQYPRSVTVNMILQRGGALMETEILTVKIKKNERSRQETFNTNNGKWNLLTFYRRTKRVSHTDGHPVRTVDDALRTDSPCLRHRRNTTAACSTARSPQGALSPCSGCATRRVSRKNVFAKLIVLFFFSFKKHDYQPALFILTRHASERKVLILGSTF